MLHEPPRAFECDRIALRAIGKADQLDDRARMLEEIAAYDALPGRPLGVKAEIIDTLGMEVGARERLEIGPVDDRTVFEDHRLAHHATHTVLLDREMAGVTTDLALAHCTAIVAADRGFVDRHHRPRSPADHGRHTCRDKRDL